MHGPVNVKFSEMFRALKTLQHKWLNISSTNHFHYRCGYQLLWDINTTFVCYMYWGQG